jgi:hypothetical protein
LNKKVLHNKKKHFQKKFKNFVEKLLQKNVENIMVKNCGEKIWNQTKFRKIIEKNWRKHLKNVKQPQKTVARPPPLRRRLPWEPTSASPLVGSSPGEAPSVPLPLPRGRQLAVGARIQAAAPAAGS